MIALSTLSIVSLIVSVSYSIPPPSLVGRAAFTLSNGEQAQQLNAQFATLKSTDSCTDGQQACVDGQFAQCVGGAWAVVGCSGGTQCFALPLVNKAGTSITCDTEADAEARIAATGATGGLTGSGKGSGSKSGSGSDSEPSKASPTTTIVAPESTSTSEQTSSTSSSGSSTSSFALANGEDAQKLNAKFASLTPSSPCEAGENACLGGKFAQCVGGAFVAQPCAGGTQCFALPLVNSRGTSITCATEADALTRIQNTGATGGIDG